MEQESNLDIVSGEHAHPPALCGALTTVWRFKPVSTSLACAIMMLGAQNVDTATTAYAESQYEVGKIVRAANTAPSGRTVAVHVTYDYTTEIVPSVKARVNDSFDFTLPLPVQAADSADLPNVELEFENYPSQVSNIHDARKGCVPPEVQGSFERMEVTRVSAAGRLINVEGRQNVPGVRVARREGGCSVLDQARPGTLKIDFIGAFIPPGLFEDTLSTRPQVAKGIGTGSEWVWTFTPQ